jgi:hypothetical protein
MARRVDALDPPSCRCRAKTAGGFCIVRCSFCAAWCAGGCARPKRGDRRYGSCVRGAAYVIENGGGDHSSERFIMPIDFWCARDSSNSRSLFFERPALPYALPSLSFYALATPLYKENRMANSCTLFCFAHKHTLNILEMTAAVTHQFA